MRKSSQGRDDDGESDIDAEGASDDESNSNEGDANDGARDNDSQGPVSPAKRARGSTANSEKPSVEIKKEIKSEDEETSSVPPAKKGRLSQAGKGSAH